MTNSMSIVVLLSLCVLLCLTLSYLIWDLTQTRKTLQNQLKIQQVFYSDQIQMLMNRIQAGDLKTLLSLQVNSNEDLIPFTVPVSQTDEAELARLGQVNGLGYELNDEPNDDSEFAATLAELGVGDVNAFE